VPGTLFFTFSFFLFPLKIEPPTDLGVLDSKKSQMSTKKKVIIATTPKAATTVQRAKATTSAPKSTVLIFGKTNYMLMLVGLALIGFGLVLMSGGAMPDPNTWDESLIYSRRRTVIAPAIILIGLVVEIVAIFKSPGSEVSPVEEVA
jgi:hypothetical protein